MLEFEQMAREQGYRSIAGVDEVGRGCLFGDVVAAAAILPEGWHAEGINDSKKLSAKKRNQFYLQITTEAIAWAVARVDAKTIDRINIRQASRLAMKIAVESLGAQPDYLLIDAEKIDSQIPQLPIIKGDARSQSIAAASIIAKVTRDRLCEEHWDLLYPGYGIAVHKGYATKQHRDALQELGPSPLHRKSFLKQSSVEQQVLFD